MYIHHLLPDLDDWLLVLHLLQLLEPISQLFVSLLGELPLLLKFIVHLTLFRDGLGDIRIGDVLVLGLLGVLIGEVEDLLVLLEPIEVR